MDFPIIEINDPSKLESLRLPWRMLLGQTRRGTFFQSLDWLQTYWKHFGADQELRVLVTYHDGKPFGILPMCVRREKTRAGSVRCLTYPLSDWGSFYGPIGPNPTVVLRRAMMHLRSRPRDWDLLDPRWIDNDGIDHGRTEQAMRAAGFHPVRQLWAESPEIDLTQGWTSYWDSRDTKWRKNVRRSERRLAEVGTVEYVRCRPEGRLFGDDDPRWELYDECVEIAARSWQGSSDSGTTLSHESVRGFLRDAHAAAAAAGALDMSLLRVDGRPVAFVYNYHCDGRLFGLRMGYDPEFSRFSPGSILLRRIIENSCLRGDESWDMGCGYADVKRPWATHYRRSYRYTAFSPTSVPAQLLRLKSIWTAARFHGAYLAGEKRVCAGEDRRSTLVAG